MKPPPRVRASTQQVEVWVGESARPVGTLGFTSQGQRESSVFQYSQTWLADRERFIISSDLPLLPDRQFRKAPGRNDPVFHFAIADTAPDGWGCRVIARDHAKPHAMRIMPTPKSPNASSPSHRTPGTTRPNCGGASYSTC